ncbi:hypothetical protein [Orrella marina]|uniref:Uncharacterized protein n=1 Tax=Orrella marina TaxID=2163011 RepID=A0A2R4XN15_9BURK|nr:hypothetical protein [Orrella marina]AWB35200.1 hypothetical protein DBV39_17295 [Orrella marina]
MSDSYAVKPEHVDQLVVATPTNQPVDPNSDRMNRQPSASPFKMGAPALCTLIAYAWLQTEVIHAIGMKA